MWVEGSLRNDTWEKDGVKHHSMKVRVNNFAKLFRYDKKNKSQANTNVSLETEEIVAF